MPSHTEITVPQLLRRIGLPDAPVILDIRLPEDARALPAIIPGSRRVAFDQVEALLPVLGQRPIVTVCHEGLKLSHGTAALLRSHGLTAEALEGGFVAWHTAQAPTIPVAVLPTGSLWVTRARPKIDRIACPWLIRRFVDEAARFLFVPPAHVQGVADRFGAIPFDMPDGLWSHRGARCTFDAMLDDWTLRTEPLDRLSQVIRAADTDRHDLAPQAAGLLAVSVGLSRQYRDDTRQLEAGLGLYDALYRWARDGHDEGHDWPGHRP
jgi:rhodanese-related sulfurtransferase